METQIINVDVPVIDGRGAEWTQIVGNLLELRKNFILICCDEEVEVNRVTNLIGYVPDKLQKWEIISLQNLITDKDEARLKEAVENRDLVFFIKTLKRPEIRPPRTKQFTAYCEYRGIVGDADSIEGARKVCELYSAKLRHKEGFPFVRIYEWNGKWWEPLRLSCM